MHIGTAECQYTAPLACISGWTNCRQNSIQQFEEILQLLFFQLAFIAYISSQCIAQGLNICQRQPK